MESAALEIEAGSRDLVLHRRRHEHFASPNEAEHAGTNVDRESAQAIASDFAFARVNSGADGQPEITHGTHQRLRAPNRPTTSVATRLSGAVERRSESEIIERMTAMVPGVTGV